MSVASLGLFLLLASAAAIPAPPADLDPDPAPGQATFTLYADLSGWLDDVGTRNPSLRILPGEGVTVAIVSVNSLHNWAIYPAGTTWDNVTPGDPKALVRSSDVSSDNTTTSVTFSLPEGLYEYFCEYHPFSMHGRFAVGVNDAPTLGSIAVPSGAVAIGEVAGFSVDAADPDGDPLSYAWDFGDGSNSNGTSPAGSATIAASHAFGSVGTFHVTITVSDPDGENASSSVEFVVVPPSTWTGWLPVVAGSAAVAGAGTVLLIRSRRRRRRRGRPGVDEAAGDTGPRDDSK